MEELFVEKYHRVRKLGGSGMSDTQPYPYETRLNIYYKPLEIVEEKQLSDDCKFQWYNQTLNTMMTTSFFTSLRVNF